MKKVFVVTSGSYSDYGIDAIFDNKELAQQFCDTFNNEDNYDKLRIEEWDLNPFKKELKQNRKPYFLRMSKDGIASDIHLVGSSFGFKNEKQNVGMDCNKNAYFHVFADDEKHAIKIANEKRIQLIANNFWK